MLFYALYAAPNEGVAFTEMPVENLKELDSDMSSKACEIEIKYRSIFESNPKIYAAIKKYDQLRLERLNEVINTCKLKEDELKKILQLEQLAFVKEDETDSFIGAVIMLKPEHRDLAVQQAIRLHRVNPRNSVLTFIHHLEDFGNAEKRASLVDGALKIAEGKEGDILKVMNNLIKIKKKRRDIVIEFVKQITLKYEDIALDEIIDILYAYNQKKYMGEKSEDIFEHINARVKLYYACNRGRSNDSKMLANIKLSVVILQQQESYPQRYSNLGGNIS